jgi:hypothetical protein
LLYREALFKQLLSDCGWLAKKGKKKGGVKSYTIIELEYQNSLFAQM